jgi:hypothetical protein
MKFIRLQVNQLAGPEYAGGVHNSSNGRVVRIQLVPKLRHLLPVGSVGLNYVNRCAAFFQRANCRDPFSDFRLGRD